MQRGMANTRDEEPKEVTNIVRVIPTITITRSLDSADEPG